MGSHSNTMAKRVAKCGVLVALAFIFSYVEILIPFSVGIPGVKLGLANLVVLSCLFFISPAEVFLILVTRIFLSGFLFGNMAAIFYSLAGGILSFLGMILLKKTNAFSMIGVSILGGVLHNLGQLIVACFIVENPNLFFYLPILLVAGSISGLVIGIIAKKCSFVFRFVL